MQWHACNMHDLQFSSMMPHVIGTFKAIDEPYVQQKYPCFSVQYIISGCLTTSRYVSVCSIEYPFRTPVLIMTLFLMTIPTRAEGEEAMMSLKEAFRLLSKMEGSLFTTSPHAKKRCKSNRLFVEMPVSLSIFSLLPSAGSNGVSVNGALPGITVLKTSKL